MTWNTQKLNTKCPYYVTHSAPTRGSSPLIVCENPEGLQGYKTSLMFRSSKERDEHMGEYCSNDYVSCPWYQIREKMELDAEGQKRKEKQKRWERKKRW